LRDAIREIRAIGMRGVNLTIPHKSAVMGASRRIAPDAAIVGGESRSRREGDRLIGREHGTERDSCAAYARRRSGPKKNA